MTTRTRCRRLQLPVMQISSLEDCLAITAWATLAVIRGTIDKGTADAAIRAAREWRQANQAVKERDRRKELERRIAEIEAAKRP